MSQSYILTQNIKLLPVSYVEKLKKHATFYSFPNVDSITSFDELLTLIRNFEMFP